MVGSIFLIILGNLFFSHADQDRTNTAKIIFSADFSTDSVFMEDSLRVILTYKNNSDGIIKLHPEAAIGLVHNSEYFITYDSPQRVTYKLHDFCNYNKVVKLNSGEGFKYTFNVKAKRDFFYAGENTIVVYYHLFDKPVKGKTRKKSKSKPILSLWSPPVKIYVNSNE